MAGNFFAGEFFAGGFFGAISEPQVPTTPSGAAMRPFFGPREEPELFVGGVEIVSASGSIFVLGHKAVEYPPDEDIITFLGMI